MEIGVDLKHHREILYNKMTELVEAQKAGRYGGERKTPGEIAKICLSLKTELECALVNVERIGRACIHDAQLPVVLTDEQRQETIEISGPVEQPKRLPSDAGFRSAEA